jgi:hypothetical protein
VTASGRTDADPSSERGGRSSIAVVNFDSKTLNLAAPILCTMGSLVALLSVLRRGPRTMGTLLSSVFGLVGSAAWAMSAYQDSLDGDIELDLDAA